MSCEVFPVATQEQANPAIQLFGNRLFNDQLPVELLIELLLVASSKKRIGDTGVHFTSALPPWIDLSRWPHEPLGYAPKARLNLKLFALMGASRLDSRHATHRQHYKELLQELRRLVLVNEPGSEDDVLRTLENLLLGFQGAGSGRTWCAQSFLPVSRGLLAGETIWNETAARRTPPYDWDEVLAKQSEYLTMNKHRFLARGGELLYLQLCNALRQPQGVVQPWVEVSGVGLEPAEQNPAWLHEQLQTALTSILDLCPQTLTEIAEFLDSNVEAETAKATDTDRQRGNPRFVEAGWCAAESWQEGYLFAVDLWRLCTADLDMIERLSLLESACAMQLLRTLMAQSARHSASDSKVSWPGYRLAVSGPAEDDTAVKRISRHTAKVAERLIYHAIRSEDVSLPSDQDKREKVLKEADKRYGPKLFTGMAKRVGFLIPKRGAGMRFTLNEQLLRLLVMTAVPAGGRLTYDTFKKLVEARHGLVFDADGFSRASQWAGALGRVSLGNAIDNWLQEMLEAAGLLVRLSDSCALVVNRASKKGTRP